MEKIIGGVKYHLPGNLTPEQEAIYTHIIDRKQQNISTERGSYRGTENDAILADETTAPAMMYKPIIPLLEEMQHSEFAYKQHKYAKHAVSSQTACINLFMPLLLSEAADHILHLIPGSPSDFSKIARDKLFRGFCFEYWGQDIAHGAGLLNDHSKIAGTDADIAIAYYNTQNKLCLWLIEHKLSEKEFTKCGAYKSKANLHKENCTQCNLTDIANDPSKCHYHRIGYKYWDNLLRNRDCFHDLTEMKGCPFREGLNQLWRNQMLAFALQATGKYQNVKFSVCHHAKNSMLNRSIHRYKVLTDNNEMFSSFTNYDILTAVDTQNTELQKWLQWYRDLYCF